MKQLYVDDQLIDLHPNTVIAQTLQVFDPGRLGSVVTNYTSSIRAPRTFNNEQTFGFLSNTKTKSTVPYSSLSCKYFEDGLPIIRNARVIITEVAEDYALTIYSGPWGFFEIIQDKTLWDLDFLDINGPWDDAARDGYRNTITGILQALLDDGQLESSTPPVIDYQEAILRSPQIYYHTVVEKIFSTYGFEVEGDIFTHDIYKKLAIPLSVAYKDPHFLEAKIFSAAADGLQVMVNPASATNVIFDQNVKQGSDNFYDGVSEYVVVNTDTALGYFKVIVSAEITIVVTGGTVDIRIESTGFTPDEELNKGSGTYSLSFQATTGHADGDITKVTITTNSGTPTVEIINGVFYNYPYSGIEDENDDTYLPTIVTEYVYFQKLFEEVKLLDFLKEFCVRFNVQITQINNVLHVNTLNLILDDRSGPDWTMKRDAGQPDRIKYNFNSYGRTNILKTPINSSFTPDITSVYGDASFDIPNENLKETQTIYTSIFAATQMINTFGVFMLKLNVTRVNEDTLLPEFVRYPGNRLFFVRDKYDFEPDVVYDSVDRDDYLVAYFFDPTQDYELSWQLFIDNFQQKFIDRCLRAVRLVERFYNLNDLDIYAFNQQVPVWDNGERFLVTKIINRVARKKVKVELLKIEANPENYFTSGAANDISGDIEDYIEVIGDTVPEELIIQMQLVESVTGNPTWETEFDNGDVEVLSCLGNGSSDSGLLVPHVGEVDVIATVDKTDNDGFGTPGFPTDTGWVEWLRDGVQEHTDTFTTASPAAAQGLTYTFPDVVAFEILKVIVHEDGTSP